MKDDVVIFLVVFGGETPSTYSKRKWIENEEMKRKWRENEEMERD